MKKALFIMLCAALASCAGGGEKAAVEVMSFNIRLGIADDGGNSWDNRKEAVVRMIEAVDPGVIGLQEAMSMQNDYLAAKLPGYTQIGVGRDDGASDGEHMLVMFDNGRYDLLDSGNFWLSETPDKVSRGWDGACNRMVTWAELADKATGRDFFIFNTHLDHMGPQARREGVKLLNAKIDEIAGKSTVFVTGDFNAPQQDDVMKPMFDRFKSARDESPKTDSHGSFNGFGTAPNSIVIDYIFYRRATPEQFRTVTGDFGAPFVSDHYPIVAEFRY